MDTPRTPRDPNDDSLELEPLPERPPEPVGLPAEFQLRAPRSWPRVLEKIPRHGWIGMGLFVFGLIGFFFSLNSITRYRQREWPAAELRTERRLDGGTVATRVAYNPRRGSDQPPVLPLIFAMIGVSGLLVFRRSYSVSALLGAMLAAGGLGALPLLYEPKSAPPEFRHAFESNMSYHDIGKLERRMQPKPLLDTLQPGERSLLGVDETEFTIILLPDPPGELEATAAILTLTINPSVSEEKCRRLSAFVSTAFNAWVTEIAIKYNKKLARWQNASSREYHLPVDEQWQAANAAWIERHAKWLNKP